MTYERYADSGFLHYYKLNLKTQSCGSDPDRGEECDPASLLLMQVWGSFSYDKLGNSSTETVETGNRLRSYAGYTLNYDADGRSHEQDEDRVFPTLLLGYTGPTRQREDERRERPRSATTASVGASARTASAIFWTATTSSSKPLLRTRSWLDTATTASTSRTGRRLLLLHGGVRECRRADQRLERGGSLLSYVPGPLPVIGGQVLEILGNMGTFRTANRCADTIRKRWLLPLGRGDWRHGVTQLGGHLLWSGDSARGLVSTTGEAWLATLNRTAANL